MVMRFFSGFETGDTGEWTTLIGTTAVVTSPVATGNYAGKLTSTGSNSDFEKDNLVASTTYGVRFRFYVHVTTAPSPATTHAFFVIDTLAGSGDVGGLILTVNTDSSLQLQMQNFVTSSPIGPLVTVSADTWHVIQFKAIVSATLGLLEWKLDAAVQATGQGLNTGSVAMTSITLQCFVSTGSTFIAFDDVAADDADYPGLGRCLARQGLAGTPTYDSFTKVGGADAATNWSETPFSATNSCTSIVNGGAQTMLTSPFTTPQAGHGPEKLWTAKGLTINGCKTGMVAKVAVATNHSIRRRLAGADTDTSVAVGTADAYFDDGIWVDTMANLNAAEIGVLHGTNVNLLTIEDMWLMIDYERRFILGPH